MWRKLDLQEMGEVVVAHATRGKRSSARCAEWTTPRSFLDLRAIHRQYVDCVRRRAFLEITQLNQEFHLRMHLTVGNSLFYDFAESTHRHVRRLNVYIYKAESADPAYQSEQFANALDQHNQIIEAVENRDRDALKDLLPRNARYTQSRLVRLVQSRTVGSG